MKGKHRTTKTFLWMIPLLVAGLACAMLGAPSAESSGGALPPPAGTPSAASDGGSGAALPTATLGNAVIYPEGAAIDLCAFATPAEVQAVLGATPTKAAYFAGGQNCTLSVDDTHLMIVQAGHEADGKAMHLDAMVAQRAIITDPTALATLDQIEANQANLSMLELVRQALPVWRATGFIAEEDSGVGEWSFFYFGYDLPGTDSSLGEYGTGRGGKWVAVYVTSTDPAAVKAVLKPVAAALLDRLPDDFTPTGNGY